MCKRHDLDPLEARIREMKRFEGKVAVVTGGASGIGAATLRRLANEGAKVVCADIDEERGNELVANLGRDGAAASFAHCDVGELSQVEAAVDIAVESYGGLDIMHNNAAWSGGGWVADIDPEDWDRSIRIMLTGVFYGCRAAIPAMLERGGGAIVNTASIEAFGGEMLASPYVTAKAGVVNFTRNVAIEYGRKGIRATFPSRDRRESSRGRQAATGAPLAVGDRPETGAEHAEGDQPLVVGARDSETPSRWLDSREHRRIP
jgi:meso-butanediol dehydrogenase/(S,S)-butanediol dehydrogenase/diacetyl reductase